MLLSASPTPDQVIYGYFTITIGYVQVVSLAINKKVVSSNLSNLEYTTIYWQYYCYNEPVENKD